MPIALTMFLDVLPEEEVFFFSPQPFSHSNPAAAHFIGWHAGGYTIIFQFKISVCVQHVRQGVTEWQRRSNFPVWQPLLDGAGACCKLVYYALSPKWLGGAFSVGVLMAM
ncbi:hypothetical protein Nepgr_006206 [Nepenthes gracilis]|uniref:Uncharacterized protein n=1 Tax=Nepenthes gracilis TaxID=150966 RepID=A0AAD3S575_NEPGR|nr:hypothetical protein Nepgr_006206 [Nepenthes gracilis]